MENSHAIKFTVFKRYCKHVDPDGYGCNDKRNKCLTGKDPRKPCWKPYCPVFRKSRVVVSTRHYENE